MIIIYIGSVMINPIFFLDILKSKSNDTNISNIHFNINYTNPFESIHNIIIKYIEFINKTQYIYYEIEEGNNTNHGIIDIKKKCNII